MRKLAATPMSHNTIMSHNGVIYLVGYRNLGYLTVSKHSVGAEGRVLGRAAIVILGTRPGRMNEHD